MNTRPTIAIVDAYSSARFLKALFAERGYDCVHVQSSPVLNALDRHFDPGEFVANIVHRGDADETAAAVAEFAPRQVLPGVESGVEVADILSSRLGLLTNGTELSAARRDKYLMMETVKQAGVPGTHQVLATDFDTLLDWYEGVEGRVVLKPLRSTGSDGVRFCDDLDELRAGFESLLGTKSALDQRNNAVLAQEYLFGREYIVDTVSLNGRHHVTDVWKMHHLSANGVRDLTAGAELMPRRGAEQDALVAYTCQVLDALGVRHGAAHTELKLTPDGPRLIETAARICGADVHVPVRAATGESQLEWTVDAYLDPERFLARCDDDYRLIKHAGIVNMVSPVAGKLVAYPRLDEIYALESYCGIKFQYSAGEEVHRSVDDWTFPLRIYLAHEIEGVVARDLITARHLDGAGFYEVE
ncbi:ATP-grasp domain-containing protein [Nonomuraea sp. NN258]|uniref:ATP-grasp domain-containing protein n=1 Tax=Nonomuraea antri TaxID=2730852 RepID=UPI00156A3934|nr:ATP-grasp domain-containing protein [Nonomuraea antri]NRQ30948.1 ATP-grasp domain-containing protein [Nonomuraea antri]